MKPPIHKSSFSLPQSQESLLTGDLRRFRDSMPPLPVLSSFWVWASSLSFDGQKMLLAPKHDTNVSTHSQWWKQEGKNMRRFDQLPGSEPLEGAHFIVLCLIVL